MKQYLFFVALCLLSISNMRAELVDIGVVNSHIKRVEVCIAPSDGPICAKVGEFLVQKELACALGAVQHELEKIGLGLQVFYLTVSREVPPYIGQRSFGDSEIYVTLLDYKTGKELLPASFGCGHKKVDRSHMTPEEQKYCDLLCATMEKHGLKRVENKWWYFVMVHNYEEKKQSRC